MNAPRRTDAHKRERSEPTERFIPIPVLYLIFVGILTIIGFIYMVRYGNDEGIYGDSRTLSALATVSHKGASGEQLFSSLCVACHQGTGKGLPGVFPPLAESEWAKATPEVPAKILLMGVEGIINVQGKPYNGQMPSFKQLSDEELAAVLTYVRSSWGNTAPPVTPEMVKTVRASLKDRTAAWKGEEELGRPQ